MKIKVVIMCALIICFVGCKALDLCPKERSYLTARQILQTSREEEIIDRIKECDDVDALRIVLFTARVTAWPMENGPNEDFDMRMDGVFYVAMQKLFSLDSKEADESIECYKRAFPPDGAYSMFLKECEEERRKKKGMP